MPLSTTSGGEGEAKNYTYKELMAHGWLLQILSVIMILLLKDKEVAEEITRLMGHISILLSTTTA